MTSTISNVDAAPFVPIGISITHLRCPIWILERVSRLRRRLCYGSNPASATHNAPSTPDEEESTENQRCCCNSDGNEDASQSATIPEESEDVKKRVTYAFAKTLEERAYDEAPDGWSAVPLEIIPVGFATTWVNVTTEPLASVDVLQTVTRGGVETTVFPFAGLVTVTATRFENVDSG